VLDTRYLPADVVVLSGFESDADVSVRKDVVNDDPDEGQPEGNEEAAAEGGGVNQAGGARTVTNATPAVAAAATPAPGTAGAVCEATLVEPGSEPSVCVQATVTAVAAPDAPPTSQPPALQATVTSVSPNQPPTAVPLTLTKAEREAEHLEHRKQVMEHRKKHPGILDMVLERRTAEKVHAAEDAAAELRHRTAEKVHAIGESTRQLGNRAADKMHTAEHAAVDLGHRAAGSSKHLAHAAEIAAGDLVDRAVELIAWVATFSKPRRGSSSGQRARFTPPSTPRWRWWTGQRTRFSSLR
jgi:hypothetical protein